MGLQLTVIGSIEDQLDLKSLPTLSFNLQFFFRDHLVYRELHNPNPLDRQSLNFLQMTKDFQLILNLKSPQDGSTSDSEQQRTIQKVPLYYKIPFYVIALIGSLGLIFGVCFASCLPIGVKFLKFFQIVEIMGKLIFVPVEYKGTLLRALEFLAALGELIEVDKTILVRSTKIFNMRTWGKMTSYREPKNVLQAIPINCILLIVRKS